MILIDWKSSGLPGVFQGSHDGITWKSLILGNPSICLVTQSQAKSVLKFFFWVMKQNTQEMVENLGTEIKFGSFLLLNSGSIILGPSAVKGSRLSYFSQTKFHGDN